MRKFFYVFLLCALVFGAIGGASPVLAKEKRLFPPSNADANDNCPASTALTWNKEEGVICAPFVLLSDIPECADGQALTKKSGALVCVTAGTAASTASTPAAVTSFSMYTNCYGSTSCRSGSCSCSYGMRAVMVGSQRVEGCRESGGTMDYYNCM